MVVIATEKATVEDRNCSSKAQPLRKSALRGLSVLRTIIIYSILPIDRRAGCICGHLSLVSNWLSNRCSPARQALLAGGISIGWDSFANDGKPRHTNRHRAGVAIIPTGH
ncbi:hypothetical protein I7I51_06222 [Histoplasma capsulatum]|uniref:Uncharacterized protein n=1 Tax=Ajellomyces capsulatus TaxID=5037 RepID=A0A8A1MJT0_AJECA|nr:hypothetical protein I7I51_06222 [Histoplasma capsulatum]